MEQTTIDDTVVSWLLASDPSVRWQALRDVLGEPEEVWQPVRAAVATHGWGAQLLGARGEDGLWAGGAFMPADFTRQLWEDEGQPWTSTTYVTTDLRHLGLEPSASGVQEMVQLVGANGRWEHDGQPFWDGEVEECINGRTLADGAYFGVDMSALAERLVTERQPDGGWNCERANGSDRSSFDTTINVLEGLLEFDRATGGTDATAAARRSGEEYLLARGLMRRQSTAEVVDPDYLHLRDPHRWRYDVLRALDYFRDSASLSGSGPDARLADAVELLRQRRLPDGRWPVDGRLRGRQWFEYDDGPGTASPRITLRALRVLRWADG